MQGTGGTAGSLLKRNRRRIAFIAAALLLAWLVVWLALGGWQYLCVRLFSGTPVDVAAYDAATALGRKGTGRSFGLLVSALDSGDRQVRGNALCGLDEWQRTRGGTPELFRVLVDCLDDPDPFLPSSALRQLIETRGGKTVYERDRLFPVVRQAMKDPKTRGMAICGLRDLGPQQEDVDAIVACLADSDRQVRGTAATVLAQLGLVEYAPDIRRAAKEEKDRYAKEFMESALRDLAGKPE